MSARKEMLLSLAASEGNKAKAIAYLRIYTISISTFAYSISEKPEIIKTRNLSPQDLDLIREELVDGQPFYNLSVIVYFYTLAEETIKNCLKAFFIYSNHKEVNLSGIKESKRGFFIEFLGLSIAEREKNCDDLIYRFEGLFRSNYKYGPERFIAFFEALGFDFEEDFAGMQEYLEFAQVRNCLIHNNGIIDQKLIELCPKYSASEGTRLVISFEDVSRFIDVERSFTYFLSKSIVKYYESSGEPE